MAEIHHEYLVKELHISEEIAKSPVRNYRWKYGDLNHNKKYNSRQDQSEDSLKIKWSKDNKETFVNQSQKPESHLREEYFNAYKKYYRRVDVKQLQYQSTLNVNAKYRGSEEGIEKESSLYKEKECMEINIVFDTEENDPLVSGKVWRSVSAPCKKEDLVEGPLMGDINDNRTMRGNFDDSENTNHKSMIDKKDEVSIQNKIANVKQNAFHQDPQGFREKNSSEISKNDLDETSMLERRHQQTSEERHNRVGEIFDSLGNISRNEEMNKNDERDRNKKNHKKPSPYSTSNGYKKIEESNIEEREFPIIPLEGSSNSENFWGDSRDLENSGERVMEGDFQKTIKSNNENLRLGKKCEKVRHKNEKKMSIKNPNLFSSSRIPNGLLFKPQKSINSETYTKSINGMENSLNVEGEDFKTETEPWNGNHSVPKDGAKFYHDQQFQFSNNKNYRGKYSKQRIGDYLEHKTYGDQNKGKMEINSRFDEAIEDERVNDVPQQGSDCPRGTSYSNNTKDEPFGSMVKKNEPSLRGQSGNSCKHDMRSNDETIFIQTNYPPTCKPFEQGHGSHQNHGEALTMKLCSDGLNAFPEPEKSQMYIEGKRNTYDYGNVSNKLFPDSTKKNVDVNENFDDDDTEDQDDSNLKELKKSGKDEGLRRGNIDLRMNQSITIEPKRVPIESNLNNSSNEWKRRREIRPGNLKRPVDFTCGMKEMNRQTRVIDNSINDHWDGQRQPYSDKMPGFDVISIEAESIYSPSPTIPNARYSIKNEVDDSTHVDTNNRLSNNNLFQTLPTDSHIRTPPKSSYQNNGCHERFLDSREEENIENYCNARCQFREIRAPECRGDSCIHPMKGNHRNGCYCEHFSKICCEKKLSCENFYKCCALNSCYRTQPKSCHCDFHTLHYDSSRESECSRRRCDYKRGYCERDCIYKMEGQCAHEHRPTRVHYREGERYCPPYKELCRCDCSFFPDDCGQNFDQRGNFRIKPRNVIHDDYFGDVEHDTPPCCCGVDSQRKWVSSFHQQKRPSTDFNTSCYRMCGCGKYQNRNQFKNINSENNMQEVDKHCTRSKEKKCFSHVTFQNEGYRNDEDDFSGEYIERGGKLYQIENSVQLNQRDDDYPIHEEVGSGAMYFTKEPHYLKAEKWENEESRQSRKILHPSDEREVNKKCFSPSEKEPIYLREEQWENNHDTARFPLSTGEDKRKRFISHSSKNSKYRGEEGWPIESQQFINKEKSSRCIDDGPIYHNKEEGWVSDEFEEDRKVDSFPKNRKNWKKGGNKRSFNPRRWEMVTVPAKNELAVRQYFSDMEETSSFEENCFGNTLVFNNRKLKSNTSNAK